MVEIRSQKWGVGFARVLAVGLVLLSVGLGCDDGVKSVTETGRITYLDFEGGFYGIIGDDGYHYLPENLDALYWEDGLRISFEGILTHKATTKMWGTTIHLERIERLQ